MRFPCLKPPFLREVGGISLPRSPASAKPLEALSSCYVVLGDVVLGDIFLGDVVFVSLRDTLGQAPICAWVEVVGISVYQKAAMGASQFCQREHSNGTFALSASLSQFILSLHNDRILIQPAAKFAYNSSKVRIARA